MQNGPADQADLADFIARGNKPDLVALLRHAGERLPSGSDTTADHRVVLLQYLRRAPGHLVLALESLRAGDDVAEGAIYGDSGGIGPIPVGVIGSPETSHADHGFMTSPSVT